MSSFNVNPEQLDTQAGTLKSISSSLKSRISELDSLRSRIRACNSLSNKGYAETVATLRQRLSNISDEVAQLSSKLERIAAIYRECEADVINHSGSASAATAENLMALASALAASGIARDKIRGILEDSAKTGMVSMCSYSADPVNLSNGNYVYENNFFNYDTPLPINLRIFYNIQNPKIGAIGKGWTISWEKRLVLRNDHAWVSMEDDSRKEFYITESGVFLPLYASPVSLEKRGENYLYRDEKHAVHEFDASGRIVCSRLEERDYTVTYHYDGDRLLRVSDSLGDAFSMEYSRDDKITSVSDAAGRKVTFAYDGDQLTAVTDPVGNRTGYEYDGGGCLTKIISPSGDTVLVNAFDRKGRTVSQTFADGGIVRFSYNDAARLVTMTQQNGAEIRYEHDDRFRHVRTVYPDGEECSEYNDDNLCVSRTDARGGRTFYEYNIRGELVKTTNPLGEVREITRAESGQILSETLNGVLLEAAEYDDKNRRTSVADANGNKAYYEYDVRGNVTGVIHEDGSRSEFSYDEKGRLLKVLITGRGETCYEYDGCRRVTAVTDALGNRTEFAYDGNDNLTKVTDPEGNVQTYTYDAFGNLTSFTDYNGGVTSYTFNGINKPASYTDADGNTTTFRYDSMWNVSERTDPDGSVMKFGYDARGRLNRIEDPLGHVITAEYDACGNMVSRTTEEGGVFRMEYDALNRIKAVTDPMGLTVKASYDMFGNVISVDHGEGSVEYASYDRNGNMISRTDRNGNVTTYAYNELSRITEVSDSAGWLTRYSYYPGGLLRKEEYPDGTWNEFFYDEAGRLIRIGTQSEGGWLLQYNAHGRVTGIRQIDGPEEHYEYDPAGNVTAIIEGNGARTEYEYSKAGDLIRVRDAEGTETGYVYDSRHRMTHILQPEDGKLRPEDVNAFNKAQGRLRVTSFTYDAAGHMISRVNPEGSKADFAYDACGRLSLAVDEDGNRIQFSYNADGTRKEITLPDARTIRYRYNALEQLDEIEDWLGTMKIRMDAEDRLLRVEDQQKRTVSYEWNNRNQIEKITYPDGSAAEYTFDDARRVSGFRYGGEEWSLRYNAAGQVEKRVSSGGVTSEYTYNRSGRPTGIRHSLKGTLLEELAFTYDSRGLQSSVTRTSGDASLSGLTEYTYDSLGRLSAVARDKKPQIQYTYDIFSNRTALLKKGNETAYTYNRLNQLVSMVSGGETRTYGYDRRGDLTEVFLDGEKTDSYEYDAMGLLIRASTAAGNAAYEYNGLRRRTAAEYVPGGGTVREEYVYDYVKRADNLLTVFRGNAAENQVWHGELTASVKAEGTEYYLQDQRNTPTAVLLRDGSCAHMAYDPFGMRSAGTASFAWSFTGYREDPVTGLLHANQREYSAKAGRFTTPDLRSGIPEIPSLFHAFAYCLNDPINLYDPLGLWPAAVVTGLWGAVKRTATTFAKDVVASAKSIKNGGGLKFSSLQTYAGAAAGGFAEGFTYGMTGSTTLAMAAGDAVQTFTTNGLNMLTKQPGYENYSLGDLGRDTLKSGLKGAVAGAVAEPFNRFSMKNLDTLQGVTAGKGSWASTTKQLLTKTATHQIGRITSHSAIWKGVAIFGVIAPADALIEKAVDSGTDWVSDKIIEGGEKAVKWTSEKIKDLFSQKQMPGETGAINYTESTARALSAACDTTGSRPSGAVMA